MVVVVVVVVGVLDEAEGELWEEVFGRRGVLEVEGEGEDGVEFRTVVR